MTTGIPALRGWQITAQQKLKDAWSTSVSAKALIAACPGAGKTLFAVIVTNELMGDDEVHLTIVLVPTINIQKIWVAEFDSIGIKATDEASNASLEWRKKANVSMTEDNKVLVLTYAQLARDSELIAEAARRAGKTFLIGDEIHHADDEETFGEAVQLLADRCARTLALTGTPFNSTGGALALCDSKLDIDPITGKPMRITVPTDKYDYGTAIVDRVCRRVEFIKVYGRGQATYRLLSNNELFKRIIDLAKKNKGDRISVLLDPNGEFMEECARQAVRALVALRAAGDKKAAMLVVARNKLHGADMAELLERICQAEKCSFFIQQIYNDTPKAHDRITNLKNDTTDIIVSVRMLSEGVDVKRLRVGLFATDWMTRMFFIQFIGRFARYEDRLDQNQFSHIVIPAHITLLEYALEIEKMIEASALVEEGGGGGGGGKKKTEFVEATTEAGDIGVVYRAQEFDDMDLAEAFFQRMPDARGSVPNALAIQIAKEMGLNGASPGESVKPKTDWSVLNDNLVGAVVRRLRNNVDKTDEELYGWVQSQANRAVGIVKKDKMTAEDTLIKRHAYLQAWLKRIVFGEEDAA